MTSNAIETSGLEASTNGRICKDHDVCGEKVQVGSVVQFKAVKVTIGDMEEGATAAHLVLDGEESCRAGFLGKCAWRKRQQHQGNQTVVSELLAKSENSVVRLRSHKRCGVASAIIKHTQDKDFMTAA